MRKQSPIASRMVEDAIDRGTWCSFERTLLDTVFVFSDLYPGAAGNRGGQRQIRESPRLAIARSAEE